MIEYIKFLISFAAHYAEGLCSPFSQDLCDLTEELNLVLQTAKWTLSLKAKYH